MPNTVGMEFTRLFLLATKLLDYLLLTDVPDTDYAVGPSRIDD